MVTAEILPIAPRETVVDAIVQALVQYIAENRLQAGDRLPSERALVEMLGASRLPIREALSVLKGLGIVEARHGKGFFVKRLDPAALFGMLSPLLRIQAAMDQQHLLHARLTLEMEIAALAAEHRSNQDLDVLAEELDAMRESVRDRSAYVAHDKAFHRELARAAGNPVFGAFMATITDLLAELHDRFRDNLAFRQEAVREHETIVRTVREANPEAAREAMHHHLTCAMRRL
ncbi:MAG: FadR family transcriptional regulator [Planctomycetaceae bacterium]|nr:FadR family transcriptional regulator [Planctomycetaceae bacterium]